MSVFRSDFTAGRQPCAAFREQDEGFGGNRHECFGPWEPERAGEPRCNHDHHGAGYDTCPQTHLAEEQ